MLLSIFLTVDFYLLLPSVIEKMFNPTAELTIPIDRNINWQGKSRDWKPTSDWREQNNPMFKVI